MSHRYRWETMAERDARRESAHRRGQWILVSLAVFVAVVLWQGGWLGGRNVFDAQPMGERRTPAQEARERG